MIRCLIVTTFVSGLFSIHSTTLGEDKPTQDIVDTAIAADSFKTLVQAIDAAGLATVLKSPGPFTVLAPSDKAFAALPPGTLETWLKDKQQLAAVLTYHMIPGKALAADVMKLESAKSAHGERLAIKVEDGAVQVNSAKVLKTDILCSNGVIHVIDAVLLPPMPAPPAVKRAKAALQSAAIIEPTKQIAELKTVSGEVLRASEKECVGEGSFGRGARACRRARRRGSDDTGPA
jgi:transforming growth factor-beta-induced protein